MADIYKGNGVVVLNCSDYVDKMLTILSQEEKFRHIGNVDGNDNTLQHERALQVFLLRHYKQGYISKEVYERICPIGMSRPQMYRYRKFTNQERR